MDLIFLPVDSDLLTDQLGPFEVHLAGQVLLAGEGLLAGQGHLIRLELDEGVALPKARLLVKVEVRVLDHGEVGELVAAVLLGLLEVDEGLLGPLELGEGLLERPELDEGEALQEAHPPVEVEVDVRVLALGEVGGLVAAVLRGLLLDLCHVALRIQPAIETYDPKCPANLSCGPRSIMKILLFSFFSFFCFSVGKRTQITTVVYYHVDFCVCLGGCSLF